MTHQLRDGADFSRTEHHVDPALVIDLLTVLLADGLDASPATIASTAPVRELLLCTQGSHDMCCGSRGASLMSDLHKGDSGLALRRVSHTGGHRMAPTGVTLPDGRMWGMVSVDEMAGILDQSVSPASVARRCRGWIGAEMGPRQMAERAVMAEVDDWQFDRQPRHVETVATEAGATTVKVISGDEAWIVEVGQGRAVPTIACGEPGGLPAKPGMEWRVRSLVRTP